MNLAGGGKFLDRCAAGGRSNVMWATVIVPLLAGLMACSMPYRPAIMAGDDSAIIGVVEALGSSKEIDVLLVHGMCTHDRTWFVRANKHLAEALRIDSGLKSDEPPTGRSIDGETEVFRHELDFHGRKVVTHAILWSPVTVPEKKALCYDRDDSRDEPDAAYCKGEKSNPYTRAAINRSFKNGLLNDCLADAVAYVGPRKSRIQGQMRQAIEISTSDRTSGDGKRRASETEAPTPLFLVTESLGSKIFFDTLLLMVCENPIVAAETFGRTAQIFMSANQIPLLTLAAPLATTPACPAVATARAPVLREQTEDPIEMLLRIYGAPRARGQVAPSRARGLDQFSVAVFTDPNDLLSYPLQNSRQAQGSRYRSVDVIVSNARTWFGLVENPLAAHLLYLDNPNVQNAIACGLPISDVCVSGRH